MTPSSATSKVRAALLALAALLVVSSMASAEPRVLGTSLGHNGQLFSLLSGTYGELFPEGSEAQANVSVLALRMTQPSGEQHTEVVPATLDPDTEGDAELVVEPVSGVTYVFWQSWVNLIQSRFRVSAFDGTTWGSPIEVSGPTFAWRTSPAFAVTRDSFADITDPQAVRQVNRTVLHIIWSEEGESGTWDTKYAPLVLEDGVYIGSHPVLVLNDLIDGGESGAASTDLRVAPVIRARTGENSVMVAFLDQRRGQIASVELRFAAGELSILGDTVADEVEQEAPQAANPSGVDNLVSSVRTKLLAYGDHVKPEILNPLAADLEEHLRDRVANGQDDPAFLTGDARAQLIDVGFRLTDGRVHRMTAEARAQLIDVGVRGRDAGGHRHHYDARSSVVKTLPVPEAPAATGVPASPELIASSQGTKLMLAWPQKSRILYRESTAAGAWSPVEKIVLTDQLDEAQAMSILELRVDQQ